MSSILSLAPTTLSPAIRQRHAAAGRLDALVRAEITRALRPGSHLDDWQVELTLYPRLYPATPEAGGHWTAFRARINGRQHEVSMLSVSVMFDGDTPVDFLVSGNVDVRAGGCTAAALREALALCEGPLCQVTPLSLAGALGASQTSVPTRRVN